MVAKRGLTVATEAQMAIDRLARLKPRHRRRRYDHDRRTASTVVKSVRSPAVQPCDEGANSSVARSRG